MISIILSLINQKAELLSRKDSLSPRYIDKNQLEKLDEVDSVNRKRLNQEIIGSQGDSSYE